MHDLKIAKSIGDAGAELHAIGFEGRNALPPMISCLKFGNISSDKVSEFENKRELHSIGCLHSAGAS